MSPEEGGLVMMTTTMTILHTNPLIPPTHHTTIPTQQDGLMVTYLAAVSKLTCMAQDTTDKFALAFADASNPSHPTPHHLHGPSAPMPRAHAGGGFGFSSASSSHGGGAGGRRR